MLKYNIEDVIYEVHIFGFIFADCKYFLALTLPNVAIYNGFLQILCCVKNIALNDPNPEARRASVFLISSLLRGLETYMFKVRELMKNVKDMKA